jgi:hypothetical protein
MSSTQTYTLSPRSSTFQLITRGGNDSEQLGTAASSSATRAVDDGADLPESNASTNITENTDNIVEASRLADAGAPDGGYSWVIVAACSVVIFWFGGVTYSWGVVQESLVDSGLAKASTLAFVGSLAVSCLSAFAAVNGRLVRALGARNVAYLGIGSMGLGQIFAGWATKSVPGLFITAGLIMGYGVR